MAMDDLMLKILIVAAIVSMTISMIFEKENRSIAWIEGAAILAAVFIVSVVTAWNDYKKEEQFIKLSEFNDKSNNVVVWRKNQEAIVNVEDIHVGDLVKIEAGMNIPVDAILIRGSGVAVDESAMTGESDELKKESLDVCKQRLEEHLADESATGKMDRNNHSVPSPMLLSGTQV